MEAPLCSSVEIEHLLFILLCFLMLPRKTRIPGFLGSLRLSFPLTWETPFASRIQVLVFEDALIIAFHFDLQIMFVIVPSSHRRNVLGMTRFAHLKKSKEPESFVFFLPRLPAEPGLVLNFGATALRNSVVRLPSTIPLC